MVQIIERNISNKKLIQMELSHISFNSKGTLSLCFKDDNIININNHELNILIEFITKGLINNGGLNGK